VLKCRTKVDAEKITDDDEQIKQFFRRSFLKFYLSIYKYPPCKGKEE
jgi:hypothetical protein